MSPDHLRIFYCGDSLTAPIVNAALNRQKFDLIALDTGNRGEKERFLANLNNLDSPLAPLTLVNPTTTEGQTWVEILKYRTKIALVVSDPQEEAAVKKQHADWDHLPAVYSSDSRLNIAHRVEDIRYHPVLVIVDDHPEHLDSLAKQVAWFCSAQNIPISVLTAESGQQAIRYAHSYDTALLITDQRMADMLGTELVIKLHRLGLLPRHCIITSVTDIDQEQRQLDSLGIKVAVHPKPAFWENILPSEITQALRDFGYNI